MKLLSSIGILLAAIPLTYYLHCGGCETDDADALGAIKGAGLTKPTLGGVDLMACGEGESSRHFVAVNANRQKVTGTVCCGIIAKSCTIRWGR